MSKPLGLTHDLRVTRPSQTEDAIWDAVETAIGEGWTPEQFKIEAGEAWERKLIEDAKAARKVLG
jgi:hypothetical protein